MCLNRGRLKTLDGTSTEWVLAWKAFAVDSDEPRKFYPPLYGNTSFPLREIVHATPPCMIPTAAGYIMGFHAFLTERGARKGFPYSSYVIKQVLLRKLTAKGIQYNRACIVGLEMMILP